jgi:transposase
MSQPPTKKYPAEFKERAVKLAVESDQSLAQTARDLGVNENTLHTWIGKYHRVERREQQVQDEHLYEELKRLRKENARLKEEREILKKAAAYFAQQLPVFSAHNPPAPAREKGRKSFPEARLRAGGGVRSAR